MRFFCSVAMVIALACPVFGQTQGSVEDVQIRSIDFSTQVLELHNFGSVNRSMNGWRFCTHDENNVLRYSSSGGMNGLSLAPGESLFVHWNNDSSGAAGTIDRTTIGGNWIVDLSADSVGSAVSIGIYRGGSFGNQANLNDHVQYSYNGVDNPSATPRSGPAVASGLWTAAGDWIAVDENSIAIELIDDPFPGAGSAHGSSSYEVIEPQPEVLGPATATVTTGVLNGGDVSDLQASDNADLSVRRNSAALASVVVLDLKTVAENTNPGSMEFVYEGSVFARAVVTQTISLFNYDTESFEVIDTRNAMRFNDSTVTVDVSGDVSRFVNEEGCIEARIRYQGATARMLFAANVDFAQWTVGN